MGVLADDLDCNGCNKGQCVEPVAATGNLAGNTNIESYSTTLGGKFCDCKDTGFVGEHCELPCSIECQNGGKCVVSEEKGEDGEHCSCSKAVVDGNPFVGLRCEFGATKSCMALGSESKHSFCTNGGDCQDIVSSNEQHKDCICEAGFEGPHCEYVRLYAEHRWCLRYYLSFTSKLYIRYGGVCHDVCGSCSYWNSVASIQCPCQEEEVGARKGG